MKIFVVTQIPKDKYRMHYSVTVMFVTATSAKQAIAESMLLPAEYLKAPKATPLEEYLDKGKELLL